MFSLGILRFNLGFSHMDLKGNAGLLSSFMRSRQGVCAAGIRRMAEYGRLDQRGAVLPFFNKGFGGWRCFWQGPAHRGPGNR